MPPHLTEAATLAALRRGDEPVFTALVERHHASMVQFAMSFVRNRWTAEEVVQDSWLGFLEALERFEGRSTLRTFLLMIVANKARTRARRDGRSVPVSCLVPDDAAEDPAAAERFLSREHERRPGAWAAGRSGWSEAPELRMLGRETVRLVHEAIDALPARQRVVILLHDVHGLSSAETQQALDLSEGNHRVLLHRARSRVRSALSAYLNEPAAAC